MHNHFAGFTDGVGELTLLSLLFFFVVYVLPAIIGLLIIGVGVTNYRLRRKTQSSKLPYFALLCVVLGVPLVIYWPAQYVKNKAQLQSSNREIAETVDFQVYEPSYIPQGKQLSYRALGDPKKSGNNFLLSKYGGGSLSIYQFNVEHTAEVFGSNSTECGPYDPEFGYVLRTCELFGTTQSGIDVYYNAFPPRENLLSSGDNTFAILDGTGVTLATGSLTREEVLKIYDSLKPVDAKKIRYKNN